MTEISSNEKKKSKMERTEDGPFICDVLREIGSFFGLREISRLFCVCSFWNECLNKSEFFQTYYMKSMNVGKDYEDKNEDEEWKDFVIERFQPVVRLGYQDNDNVYVLIPMEIMRGSGVLEETLDEHLEMIEEHGEYRNPRKGNLMRWSLSSDFTEEAVKKFVIYLHKLHDKKVTTDIPKPVPGNLDDIVQEWEIEFLKMDQSTVIELLMISNELNVKSLVDLCAAKIASMIKGKSPEQIREVFGMENDFTPEEEERIREENRWCEEN